MVDLRDQFKSVKCRWEKIANSMNVSGHALLLRNNVICKDKWGIIYEDFKHIFDYMDSIGNNIGYWDFIPQEKTSLNVFQQFKKVMYKLIDSFMGVCPMLHPLHLCDLMALYNNVFGFLVLQLDVKSEKKCFPWYNLLTQAKGIDGAFYTTYTCKRKSKHLGTTHSFHMNKRKPNYT